MPSESPIPPSLENVVAKIVLILIQSNLPLGKRCRRCLIRLVKQSKSCHLILAQGPAVLQSLGLRAVYRTNAPGRNPK